MKSLPKWLVPAFALCLFSCKQGAHSVGACTVLDGAAKGKLVAYVQAKYHVPSQVPIEVSDLGFVDESCYRKLDFRDRNGGPLHITLYASSDLRFLSHDLMDSGIASGRQEVRQKRELASVLARGNPAAMGQKDAPVTITIFSDFQCPYCARMADGITKEILPAETGKVRVVFRNFPLTIHPWARAAAEAAECARQQGEEYFWDFHNYLFQHQSDMTPENLQKQLFAHASGVRGLEVARLKACLDGHLTAAAIEQDIALGKELGVTGTPTAFVGTERSAGYRPDEIRALIHGTAGGKVAGKVAADSGAGAVGRKQLTGGEIATALSRGNPAVMGRKDAPVTITLFSDFQCPYCARTAEGLVNGMLPSDKNVRVLFRHFPLSMHPWARAAAEAAECARQQGEPYFRSFHDYLFQHQRELRVETLRQDVFAYAAGLRGFQVPKLRGCLDQKAAAAVVDQDVTLGQELGVTGTPTLFVGGERVVGYKPDQIRTLIQQASKSGATN